MEWRHLPRHTTRQNKKPVRNNCNHPKVKPHITKKYGVETIGVFGSHVRGEATLRSDVDILVTYKKEAHPGMFKLLELEEFLSDQLGSKVDLVTKDALKPKSATHS